MATGSKEDRLNKLYAQLGEKRQALPRYDTPDSQNEALTRQQQVLGPTNAPTEDATSTELTDDKAYSAPSIADLRKSDDSVPQEPPVAERPITSIADLRMKDDNLKMPESTLQPDPVKVKEQMDNAKTAEELPDQAKKSVDESLMNPGIRSYLKSKYGFGPEIDDAALKATQENAGLRHLATNIGEGLATIAVAPSGQKVDSSFYNNLNGQADQSIANIKDRRAGAVQEQALERSQKDQERIDAEDDPVSPESFAARDLYKKMFPDILKDLPSFDNLSARDLKEKVEKLIEAKQKSEDLRLKNKELGLRAAEAQENRDTKLNSADEDKVSKELNALSQNSRSAVGLAGRTLISADRALDLLNNKTTNQDLSSISADISNIISGTATVSGTKHQEYNTLQQKAAGIWQQITGNPTDPGVQELKNHLKDVIGKMRNISNDTIQSNLQLVKQGHPTFVSRHPKYFEDYAKALAEQLGNPLDSAPGQPATGGPVPVQASPSPTAPAASAQAELKRKTQDGKIAIYDANTKQFLRYE